MIAHFAIAATALLGCGRRAEDLLAGAPVPERVLSPIPKFSETLPEALDWRWVNGTVFTSRVGYQLLPSPCGSCWAFAATGALSDRVKIATKGRLVDFSISPQALLDCAKDAGTCNGGNPNLAYHYAATVGLPDETCLPYRGMDNSNWGESPCAERLCRRCDRFGSCNFVPRNATPAIQVAEYGSVTGVAAMKAEIAARGPIACLMYAHADSFEAYTGGVITDTTRYEGITHVVTVTGWGVDRASGAPYWVVRNSFGTAWGELGYYRQLMGKDIYNIEPRVRMGHARPRVDRRADEAQWRGAVNTCEISECPCVRERGRCIVLASGERVMCVTGKNTVWDMLLFIRMAT